jgi:hypothetical protein
VAVEKGTRVVILLNFSVFGERTFNNLQRRYLAETLRKEFFNSHAIFRQLTCRDAANFRAYIDGRRERRGENAPPLLF